MGMAQRAKAIESGGVIGLPLSEQSGERLHTRRKRHGSRTCGGESRDRHRLRRPASTDGDERGVSAHRASAFAIVVMRCGRVSARHRHVYTSSDANPPPPLNRLALPATIPAASSHFRQCPLLCGNRQSSLRHRRLSQSLQI